MENTNILTVKWVQQDGGASWFPAKAIAAVPVKPDDGAPALPVGTMGFINHVEFDTGDGSGVRSSIDRGTVYILNAAGKTIDTIQLGLSAPSAAQPIAGASRPPPQ